MFKIRKTAALAALFCSSVLNAWASADHMVIAMPQIPTIIEPQGINNNAIDRYVGNVFETLLKADQKTGELKPGLAESWCRLSPDTVEFKLRSGVRFHDGTPLTADDVVFTFGPERFSGEKAPGRAVAWEFLGNLKEVVKVDDLTVRVTMKAPDPMIERRFSARTSEIISEDGWKAAGGWEKWLKAPVGTGPYRIASFKTGNRLELTRFDGYWGKTAPAAKVSFVEVPELSARVAGLRSGEFDLITEVPPDQVKPLSADGRIDVTAAPSTTSTASSSTASPPPSCSRRNSVRPSSTRSTATFSSTRSSRAAPPRPTTSSRRPSANSISPRRAKNSTIPPRPGLSSRPRATGASPSSGASRRATTRRSSSSRRPSPPCSRPQAST